MNNVVCGHCSTINRLPEDRNANAAKCSKCGGNVFDGKPIDLSSQTF
jgi:thioredoxin 2